ncbi:hypothetical protein GCM10027034_00250 [Ramlibacter solisilvae]|uniref:S8 family peptidase n=1 Tax=Ramlibacter tataouinensis TaxID=94132 RepID=UPI0009ED3094|nr:S8 family peptidase [Ramlibacter tataouinensis]
MTQPKARLLLALLGAALALSAATASAQPGPPENRSGHRFGPSKPIAGQYIVVFNNTVADPDDESDRTVRAHGGRRHHSYSSVLKGFAATLSDNAVEKLRHDPRVAFIEQDQTVSLSGSQNAATWGLDRIDQADRPLDTVYHYSRTGAGVNAFIIDTGIRPDHVEFTGRLLPGFSSVSDANGTNDCNGHGTHVAGTVGGTTWGVAKQVSLIPVRVLNCQGSGTWSGVIAGIDWVAKSTLRPAVANMSLGGANSAAVNAAVANAVAKGVTMVVAAGNENANACNSSPASEPTAITVGATTDADARASFSNYGSCVDVFAPGVNITSAWNTAGNATNTISGTSMATPHVTGVAALALAANPSASPAAVGEFIAVNATAGRLTSLNTGSPNRLLYSMATGIPTEPPVAAVAVRSLAGQSIKAGSAWRAQVTATVRNVNTGTGVAGAVVTGSFAPGGSASCTTASNGSCTLLSPWMAGILSTVFTVGNVAGPGMAYDSTQNSASQLVIRR